MLSSDVGTAEQQAHSIDHFFSIYEIEMLVIHLDQV